MKIFKIFLTICLLSMVFIGCKRDELVPVETDDVKPGQVSDVMSESLPGTVKLTYKLPSDPDLLYVMAEYTDKYGKVTQTKASYFVNTLTVQGFADANVYKMNVYAVDRSENKSDPIVIDVKALTPPIFDVKASLDLQADFGGVNVSFTNQNESDIAIVVSYKDSQGFFVPNETVYTKSKQGTFTSRGLPVQPTVFAVYIRDRWNNRTDTVFKTLTPIFEKELDKTKFREVTFPTDIGGYGNGLVLSNIWDNKINADNSMWHSKGDAGMPMHISFDLGVTAKISRFVLWERPGPYLFNHGNPKRYEVWGSTNPPSDGSYTNWVLLKSCVSVKPSGQSPGINSTADVAAGARGEEFNVPLTAPSVRYIRVKILENWIGGLQAHIAEMSFYGNDN